MFYLPFIIFIYVYASVSMWIYAMYVGVYIQAKKRVFDTLDLKKTGNCEAPNVDAWK